MDEVLLFLGSRKAFGEPIIKSGDDKVHIYLCAKPFQEEMGISLKRVGRFLMPVQRQSTTCLPWSPLVKDMDTLLLRDDKVKPVWHCRASK